MDTESPITILIAEDDTVLQELYRDRFRSGGLVVVQAFDGEQALEQLKAHPEIGLVLLDIMMPKLSGYDVLTRIRHTPHLKDLPVIMVSALGDIDDRARGLQVGATEYITKGEMLPGVVIEKIKDYVSVPVT